MPRLPAPDHSHYDLLTPEKRRFVDEYLLDFNARGAAIRAGYSHVAKGWQLANDPAVMEAIQERREEVAQQRYGNGSEFVLNKLWDIATADPRELVEIRRVPCRFCHGTNGQYQFTRTEYDRLFKAHDYGRRELPFDAMWPHGKADFAYYNAGKAKLPFDPQGGDGYTTRRDPNPDCSECHGDGLMRQYVADTRKLSPQARQLYRGAKFTAHGTEVVMASQDEARNMLARHHNVGVERKQLLVSHIDPRQLSDEDLIRAEAEIETMLTELRVSRADGEMEARVTRQRTIATRRVRQVTAAKMRAVRNGQTMIPRPRG